MSEEMPIEFREGEEISAEEEIGIFLTYKEIKNLHDALERFRGFDEELLIIWLHDKTKISKKTIKAVIEHIRIFGDKYVTAMERKAKEEEP